MTADPEFDPNPQQPLLIVISGPSGAGKDAVLKKLKERNLPFHFVVTVNTRAPREGEVDGRDYFFVSRAEFERMAAAGELIEHAKVYNDFKGIPRQQVSEALASGKDVVLRVDVQGAATIRGLTPGALTIFLTTRSEAELVKRLKRRKSETRKELKLRIDTARKEYKRLAEFDYVVINSDGCLDQAVEAVIAIITAEHHRVAQRKINL